VRLERVLSHGQRKGSRNRGQSLSRAASPR
jgi:hypothetical protein